MVYQASSYTASGTAPVTQYPDLPPDAALETYYRPIDIGEPNGTELRADAAVRYRPQPQTDDIRIQFLVLADRWHEETDHLSSPLKIALHPAYQQIIGMGEIALPFILNDLQRRGGHWYWALRAITRQSVPLISANPTLREVKDAWLRWGRRSRLIDSQLSLAGF